jgi:hypothetical protein
MLELILVLTALKFGYFDLARTLLQFGTAPNLLEKQSDIIPAVLTMDQIHESPRGTGSWVNDLQMEMVDLLMWSLNRCSGRRRDSPLYYCYRHGKEKSFKCLIDAGADL